MYREAKVVQVQHGCILRSEKLVDVGACELSFSNTHDIDRLFF
jgi:hypothetical protein